MSKECKPSETGRDAPPNNCRGCAILSSKSCPYFTIDLHPLKALFHYSLDPYNLQLHCSLELGALFCYSFFCSLDQPCKTLQMVLFASYFRPKVLLSDSASKTHTRFRTFGPKLLNLYPFSDQLACVQTSPIFFVALGREKRPLVFRRENRK